TRRTNQRHRQTLATAPARVRYRAPTGDPVVVSASAAFLAWKSWSQAWQVMGASARVEAATRMERPQGQMAAIRLVLRRALGPAVVSPCRQSVMASVRAWSWEA